jgi:hypothetical protein
MQLKGFTALTAAIIVLWAVTPCSLVDRTNNCGALCSETDVLQIRICLDQKVEKLFLKIDNTFHLYGQYITTR